jgi:hypothetical protein
MPGVELDAGYQTVPALLPGIGNMSEASSSTEESQQLNVSH